MPLLERRRYPISACNAASHTTGVNTGSVERMQSSQWLVTIALAHVAEPHLYRCLSSR
jgi:hypothetical protein